MATEPHVVILGAGFAGVGAMKKLNKTPVKVTMIDKNDYHTFQPLLYQVATSELARTEVGYPVREMLHERDDWVFHRANVTEIDLANKKVVAEGLEPISYDYLVYALGAVVNFFGTKGAAEHAFPLYTLADAVNLKTHVLERFEAADKNPALVDDGALTFAIVGGGPTGVETAGALAELIHLELKKDYPNLPVEKAQVHLYQRGATLLPPMKENLQAYAKKALEERDVQVHLGESAVEIEKERVHLKSGEVMKAHTLVWGAGLTTNPPTNSLGVELEKGRVPVNLDLTLKDHPEVFVIGDNAMITDAKTNEKLPQLGSVALQSGYHAAENISRLVDGKQTKEFKYKDKGTMATVGRGAAVVQFHNGKTMTGHAAWMAWLGVHLTLLSGGEERVLTAMDWGWDILAHGRGKRIVVE
jgi:NADH:ubiquinone reductase (H+-translocating)